MKKFYCLLIMLSNSGWMHMNAQAPQWAWAKTTTSCFGSMIGFSTDLDSQGNIYSAGYFDFGANPEFQNGDVLVGNYGNFLVKYDTDGNLLWVRGIDSPVTGGAEIGWSVSVDANDDVVICGMSDSPTIGSGTHTLDIDGIQGGADLFRRKCFVAKYNSSGDMIWLKDFPHIQNGTANVEERMYKIQTDQENNMFLSGWVYSSDPSAYYWAFANDTLNVSSAIVVKLNSDGNPLWMRPVNNYNITVDDAGNCFVMGDWFSPDVDQAIIGNDTLTAWPLPAAGENAHAVTYITKLSPQGDYEWVTNCGLIRSSGYGDYGIVSGLTLDIEGNIYFASDWVDNPLILGTDTLIGTPDLVNGSFPIVVAKYNNDGVYQWSRSATEVGFGNVQDVAVANDGSIYLAANTFANGDHFTDLHKLGSNGEYLWSKITEYFACYSLVVDNQSDLIATGMFPNGLSVPFDSTVLYSYNAGEPEQVLNRYFTAKMLTGAPVSSVTQNVEDQVSVYPNPAVNGFWITGNGPSLQGLRFTDLSGRILQSARKVTLPYYLECSGLDTGVYLLEVNQGNRVYTERILIH